MRLFLRPRQPEAAKSTLENPSPSRKQTQASKSAWLGSYGLDGPAFVHTAKRRHSFALIVVVASDRGVVDLLRGHLRHYHPRHFRIEPANAVAPNNKVRRIEHGRLDEIHYRAIGLRPLGL